MKNLQNNNQETPGYVTYIRVSTQRQGVSGLGLEAQRADVERYVAATGKSIVAEYIEVESGRSCKRPQLEAAIARAKAGGHILLVAKLDRLARSVYFTSKLMESKLDFVAVDNPHATKFIIHILAAVAEQEADMISTRTKAALAAAKARGVKLGGARPEHWASRLATPGKQYTAGLNREAYEYAKSLREVGATFSQVADRMNAAGHQRPTGAAWTPSAVHQMMSRAEAILS